MSLQPTLSAVILLCFLVFGATEKSDAFYIRKPFETVAVDTVPPLNTIRDEDIDSVDASYKDQTITVKNKSGELFVYSKKDWKPYDTWAKHDSTDANKAIRQAIDWLTMTFTKAEVAPAFPGGQEAWDDYIKEYCKNNKKALKKAGEGVVLVQFIVDQHGVLNGVNPIGNPPPELEALAISAVSNGPRWIPATQNGRVVICYQKLAVKLSL